MVFYDCECLSLVESVARVNPLRDSAKLIWNLVHLIKLFEDLTKSLVELVYVVIADLGPHHYW